MAVTARQQRVLAVLRAATENRAIRWGLQGFVLTNSLLLVVLVLTEQLRWLRPPWPPPVTRALFEALLPTSVVCTALFGAVGVGSALYLYRRRGTDPRADAMSIVRRGVVTPVTYLLASVWAWTWLGGHSPRLFGGTLVALLVAHQVALVIYFTARAFRRHHAADHPLGTPAQAAGRGRRLSLAVQRHLAARVLKSRYAVRRRWWMLTHPGYVEKMSPPDRALFQSAARGVTQNIEVLLRRGADPNLRLQFGDPLVNFCASLGRTEAVRLLLDASADVRAASPSTGFTALHSAADKDNAALVRLLTGRGADTEARLRSGATPLLLAARKGHTGVIGLLLASGASVDAPSRRGQTPLMSAALYGHPEAVEVLLGGGADRTLRNADGRTALDQATGKGHKDVVTLLEASV